jgi:hypothetical protein
MPLSRVARPAGQWPVVTLFTAATAVLVAHMADTRCQYMTGLRRNNMTTKATTFEVKITPQRATTGTMETVVRESLKALIGFDSNVIVIQQNDTTLSKLHEYTYEPLARNPSTGTRQQQKRETSNYRGRSICWQR